MRFAETRTLFIVGREGFYPKLGSLTTGSGFAFGAGFRDRDLFDNRGVLHMWAGRWWALNGGRGSKLEDVRTDRERTKTKEPGTDQEPRTS
jgi:hypothetical protein